MAEIKCRTCESPDCHGCNMYSLEQMLIGGKLDGLMNENHAIQTEADVRPVVLCKDCRHRDPEDHKCDCGQLERAGCVFPVDDDYYCAYGEKREES